MTEILEAIGVGLVAGVAAGVLGIGGGVLFVPALVFILGESQLTAEATSLVAVIPVALVGAWRQRQYGNVCLRDAALIGALAVVGAFAGTRIAEALAEEALRVCFAVLALGVAAQLLHRFFVSGRSRDNGSHLEESAESAPPSRRR